MIRLVKIELKKIFAKKVVYIFLAVVFGLTLASALFEKNLSKVFDLVEYKANEKMYKEALDSYDLSDPEQLRYYVDDKNYYDMLVLSKDYETYSAQHMYIHNDIQESIMCLNENKYITKDQEAYNQCKKKYDEQIEFLKNYDWKQHILNKREEVKTNIQSLELGINSGVLKGKEYETQLKVAELELEVLDYRLENNIQIDGFAASEELESLIVVYTNYLGYDNEKTIVDRQELRNKMDMEEAYFIAKYKFDNKMIKNNNRTLIGSRTADNVSYIFTGSTFVLLFILLIGGGVVAEEFNKGTIKQLLLKPYTRSKILTSKIIATLITFVLFLVVYSLMTALIYGVVFNDFKSLFEPVLIYSFNKSKVVEQSLFINCFEKFISILPMYLILFAVSILVGVVTTNVTAGIVIPLVVNVGCSIINTFAKGRIFAFFPSMCWDLSHFLHGRLPDFKYSTLPISLAVDIVTIVLLFGVSYLIFKKKDIKNQ